MENPDLPAHPDLPARWDHPDPLTVLPVLKAQLDPRGLKVQRDRKERTGPKEDKASRAYRENPDPLAPLAIKATPAHRVSKAPLGLPDQLVLKVPPARRVILDLKA
jgi:hypothetical protein